MLFGLLGEKLGHSVSAAMFADVLPAVRKGAG